ncbi:MAG: leucyl/phenylalanyl-tRNA--protein transferase [Phycisphaerales bacterium]
MKRPKTIAEQVVSQILGAYRKGFFPMADIHSGEIHWHNPEVRGVIPITAPVPSGERGFHVPRSLRQKVRSGRFVVTSDKAFAATIVGCADPRRPGAWIDETIIRTYRLLHDAGHAHSVEAWLTEEDGTATLVGGLYGVSIGGAFFGESMFSLPEKGGTDASKVCLVHLVAHLRRRGYTLLDSQMWSWHLERLGAEEALRDDFLPLLTKACRKKVSWGEFVALSSDGDEEREGQRALPAGNAGQGESE